MEEQCKFWNERKKKCELRKFLDANGLKDVPIGRVGKGHEETFCKTSLFKDCWKRQNLSEMIEDNIWEVKGSLGDDDTMLNE